MELKAETLDDLLREVFTKLLKSRSRVRPTKGSNREEIGVLLNISNPRARLSRTEQRATLFSCLGETLWYLSGSASLDFIEYYIPHYRTFSDIPPDQHSATGAYGPRLFGGANGVNQVDRVIRTLKQPNRHDTRQAVIQIFDKSDIGQRDVPCTCTLQFFARGKKLHMLTSMRSNDAYLGLPHDVFAFTTLQELVAKSIDHELAKYRHVVGSLHLYDIHRRNVEQFLSEGLQSNISMPPMPGGDPWPSLKWLLNVESRIRSGKRDIENSDGIDPYWVDLARILLIKALYEAGDQREVVRQKRAMSTDVYNTFIRGREVSLTLRERQPLLPGITIDKGKS